jgi:hypothetical protein
MKAYLVYITSYSFWNFVLWLGGFDFTERRPELAVAFVVTVFMSLASEAIVDTFSKRGNSK